MKNDKIELFKESIFGYDNYRSFLKDYFVLQKKIRSSFTQRYFAQKAGFSSHTFCNYVVNGKRNLSSKTLHKFVIALDLDDVKARFFENLVQFNQTEKQEDKEYYFELMQKIKKQTKFVPLKMKQSTFYEKKYYAVIRELVVNAEWNGSFERLAVMVYPSITTKEAEDAVNMMVETKILKLKNGKYSFAKENIDDSKVPVFLKKKARKEVFERGVEVLDHMSPDQRFSAYSTFSADKKTYDKINELFLNFRQQVNELIMDAEDNDEVFQMTFGNFPVSKKS